MADKNPKHPLKKKKVTQKVNLAVHDTNESEESAQKIKKHS